ncbi:hypothetical protein YC2023_098207 [Brassica napus]
MAQYIPILDFYSNKLSVVSLSYGSSETMFGSEILRLAVLSLSKRQRERVLIIKRRKVFLLKQPMEKSNRDESVRLI